MASQTGSRLEMIAVLVVLAVVLVQMARQGIESQGSRDSSTQPFPSDALVVDVRTREEYAEGHIPGAINIPVETLGSTRPEELPVLDQRIYVYCRSGRRSAEAAGILRSLGYTDVVDFGGIDNWEGELVTE